MRSYLVIGISPVEICDISEPRSEQEVLSTWFLHIGPAEDQLAAVRDRVSIKEQRLHLLMIQGAANTNYEACALLGNTVIVQIKTVDDKRDISRFAFRSRRCNREKTAMSFHHCSHETDVSIPAP